MADDRKFVIWHNPRCSKSRQTLALLQERGITPTVRRYLDEPPGAAELEEALRALEMAPRELMRTKEGLYRELGLDDEGLDDQALITAMAEHPRLIERPVVLRGARAALGRPPEAVLVLLGEQEEEEE